MFFKRIHFVFSTCLPFCAFVSGYKHKMTYYMRTIPQISELLTPLDEVITTELIPAITGGYICSKSERSLLSLPPKLGGLGTANICRHFQQRVCKFYQSNQ